MGVRKLCFLVLLGASALAASVAAPAQARSAHRAVATGLPAGARLFAPDSVWNRRLDAAPALDSSSSARVGALVAEVDREIGARIGPWIAERDYSTPIYRARAGQRRVAVTLDTGRWGDSLRGALAGGVPIPAGARPAAGTDGHLTVYQPATDTLWEFWRATRRADGWHARWGGAMQHASTSPGYYTSHSWTGLSSSQGWSWGATATSLPVAAGTITLADVRRGRIAHALAVSVPDACAGTFTWPAQRTDGGSAAPDCLPEGAHLRLDPSLDLSQLRLPRFTRMLAEAAQRYGMIVRDRTHHAFSFYAEDPTPTGGDPYRGARGFYGGEHPWDFLPRFPWARLQLLRMSLCSAAPCTPPAGA